MSAQFTPGPWVVFSDRGTAEAVMPAMRPGDICRFTGCGRGDERNANARLISAAPDLLKALRDLEQRVTMNGGLGEYIAGPPFALTNARAAISKAQPPSGTPINDGVGSDHG